jgi:hypothetical protein
MCLLRLALVGNFPFLILNRRLGKLMRVYETVINLLIGLRGDRFELGK